MNDNADRVRRNSPPEANRRVDQSLKEIAEAYAGRGPEEITGRIHELEREWDVERWLETNASTLALSGLLLGVTVNKKWLIVPGIVLPFLLQHALQGWCPPLPVLRRFGIRTREEIDREKYALKALRGDFREIEAGPSEIVEAVRR